MSSLIDRTEIGVTRSVHHEIRTVDALKEPVRKHPVETRLIMPSQQNEDPVAGKVLDGLGTTFGTMLFIGEEVFWHPLGQFR